MGNGRFFGKGRFFWEEEDMRWAHGGNRVLTHNQKSPHFLLNFSIGSTLFGSPVVDSNILVREIKHKTRRCLYFGSGRTFAEPHLRRLHRRPAKTGSNPGTPADDYYQVRPECTNVPQSKFRMKMRETIQFSSTAKLEW